MNYTLNNFWEKKKNRNPLAILVLLFLTLIISTVQAADGVLEIFTSQSASGVWSNNSVISVDANLEYMNKWNNSSIIGNYFRWEYYDSIYGYFTTDWSTNTSQNVRIISSTPKCGTSYGYKLWWYAYSEAYGFIDLDFNSSIFVYYCLWDWELHGYGYSDALWIQNFEGIAFDITSWSTLIPEEPTGTWAFANDDTDITDNPGDPEEGGAENSDYSGNSIQGDILEFNTDKETLFYIIK